jgi:hypothetical protein
MRSRLDIGMDGTATGMGGINLPADGDNVVIESPDGRGHTRQCGAEMLAPSEHGNKAAVTRHGGSRRISQAA